MRKNLWRNTSQRTAVRGAKATCLPIVLLHALSIAVIFCMAVMAAFYAYWLIEETSSQYRRQMNALAYNAQIFFDQREQLLRSTVASAVRNLHGVSASETPARLGVTKQVEVFPLLNAPNQYEWALVMTPRSVDAYRQMQAELVFTSMTSGATQHVLAGAAVQAPPLDEDAQQWIYEMLKLKTAEQQRGESSPVIWLTPPTLGRKSLLMYIPLDETNIDAGWVGVAVQDIDAQLEFSDMRGASYALYAPFGKPLVVGAGAPKSAHIARSEAGYFGVDEWQSYIEHFVLSKSVGEAGWRLRYFMPREQVLKDVMPKWSLAFLAFVIASVGVVIGSRYIHRRILEPAQSQVRKLSESYALNKALLSASPVGLALVRRQDGEQLLANELAATWLTPQLLEGLHEVDRDVVMQEQLLADGRVVQTTFTPLKYDNDCAVLCTLNDISKLKEAEQTLVNAKNAAEKESQSKTVFFTTLSHEIRTPLYGVLGALDLLSMTTTTQQQQQYLSALSHSSKALLLTVNNTLDLARIEAGQQVLEEKSFSPLGLVEEVISSFAMRAESKRLKLILVADAAVPSYVIGDPQALRQILDNLVNNAIKFTEAGSIVIRLKASAGDDGSILKFQIVDTGVGIAPEDLQRLFEPYFRSGVKNAFKGTGLGLSICAKLAELMKATLKVNSQLGSGTCFEVSLKLPIDVNQSETESPVLLALPVYVRGAVPEVVAVTCDWLRKWGAKAAPYRQDQPVEETAVVLETWPWAASLSDGLVRRVIARPLTEVIVPAQGRSRVIEVSAYSLSAIGQGVRQAQDGQLVQTYQPSQKVFSSHARLLVVEDHPITRMVLTEQLKQMGCYIEVAENGQDALCKENIMDFDAVITDINMPILDGPQLASALREKGYKNPIIGLTAGLLGIEQENHIKSGITTLLRKPLSMMEMVQVLKKFDLSIG